MNNWYVGQKVVFIGDSRPQIKRGEVLVIKSITTAFCKCGDGISIDVGKVAPNKIWECSACNDLGRWKDDTYWFRPACFRPLDELTAEEETHMEKAIKEATQERVKA